MKRKVLPLRLLQCKEDGFNSHLKTTNNNGCVGTGKKVGVSCLCAVLSDSKGNKESNLIVPLCICNDTNITVYRFNLGFSSQFSCSVSWNKFLLPICCPQQTTLKGVGRRNYSSKSNTWHLTRLRIERCWHECELVFILERERKGEQIVTEYLLHAKPRYRHLLVSILWNLNLQIATGGRYCLKRRQQAQNGVTDARLYISKSVFNT